MVRLDEMVLLAFISLIFYVLLYALDLLELPFKSLDHIAGLYECLSEGFKYSVILYKTMESCGEIYVTSSLTRVSG